MPRILDRRAKLSPDKSAFLFPKIFVPIEEMTKALLWKEIQRAYDVMDGKLEDPHITAIAQKTRQIHDMVRAEREAERAASGHKN